MRHSFSGMCLVLCLLSTGVCRCAEPVARYSPAGSAGIELLNVGDGQWESKSIAGKQCVILKRDGSPASANFYFKLAPDLRTKVGSEAFLVVEFYDEGLGMVKTEFNSVANDYAQVYAFALLDSKKWQQALVHLDGVKFRGSQNEGADFRLRFDGPIAISRLDVYAEKPGLQVSPAKDRTASVPAAKPRGMYYTFGNDAEDASAPLYRTLGATSVESYVTWESCERKGEGQWDWSVWDEQVRVLKENGLKWVPFLILGPAYSTPKWFRESKEHVPCRCLEHETDSKIESLWNPNIPKRVDRFLAEFAKRYRDTGVIESVILGIHGDFGEAIYSVFGGGWTFVVPGEYHNHLGFWCADPYALASFRKFTSDRYKSVEAVNKAWATEFKSIQDVDLPGRKEAFKTFRDRISAGGSPGERRRWLDFMDWYRGSMTQWSDWWMGETRKYFPNTPIYLCTGGDAIPEQGSNFAEQCKAAAKHKAGVRITNEASNYGQNVYLTRWVASAGRYYGAYFGFEPAGEENLDGIHARIYNATASGANQLHDYVPNVVDSSSRVTTQQNDIKYLFHVPKPSVPVALWYPNVSMTLKWGGFYEKVDKLRDYIDFDYVDETMLRDGALSKYRVLLILLGPVMETKDAKRIAEWIGNGGQVVVMGVPSFESVEITAEPEEILFGGNPRGRTYGKGEIRRVTDWNSLADRIGGLMKSMQLPVYDLKPDNVYCTDLGDGRFLLLNITPNGALSEIELQGRKTAVTVPAKAIHEVVVR